MQTSQEIDPVIGFDETPQLQDRLVRKRKGLCQRHCRTKPCGPKYSVAAACGPHTERQGSNFRTCRRVWFIIVLDKEFYA